MKLKPAQIEFAVNQIALIDSGEKGVFLETVNTDKQIDAIIFYTNEPIGVYFSCAIFGGIRIHISFSQDTDAFNDDIATLVQTTLQKSSSASCLICLWNKNRKIIQFLKQKFQIQPYSGMHYYASIEFIMRREHFSKAKENCSLDIRPYEEKYIDKYLCLLDGAMTFVSPPPDFMGNKEEHARNLAKRAEENSLEAFWNGNELIGLYWRKGAEIDMLAVADGQQRKGYGSVILTRAIEMVFENTDNDYAYLYAVDWNIQGQSFYEKYGMAQNGHSYLLYLDKCIV